MASYPKLYLYSIDTTSVTFEIATSSWAGDTFFVFYRLANDSSDSNWKTVTNKEYGDTFTIKGLESGTKYAFRVSELDDFTGEYGDGTLSNKTTSSSAFDCGYFTTEEEAETEYTYTFVNDSDYSLYLEFYISTSDTTSLTIAAGRSKKITCAPADMEFDPDVCEVDGKSGKADCIYWQRTSPTTGSTYCLDTTSGAYISLRSSGDATYTFTVDGYTPPATTYYVTIDYDANGGVGSVSSQELSSTTSNSISVTLRSYYPTRDGYKFDGWYCAAKNKTYDPGDTDTFTGTTGGYTYTMVAQWIPYYPYYVYVYCDGDLIDDYNESNSEYEESTLNLESLYNYLLTNYEMDYYKKGSGSTEYTNFTNVSLSAGSTTYIYLFLVTSTRTVTFQHYYLDSPTTVQATTTKTVNRNTTIYPENYAKTFTHYKYDYATNSGGTKITSLKVSSNVTVKLYYALVSYTVTFMHMLGDNSAVEDPKSIKAKSTITLEDYAGSYSGYRYDHAEDNDGYKIITLTVTSNVKVYLFYTLSTVKITYNHYRGSKKVYTATTETVNYGTSVTVANKKITSIPNCIYNKASTTSFTATTDTTVSLYYIFEWTYEKAKGVEFNLTATEWNNLIAFVNDQRSSNYSFTSAVKGNPFTAAIYNEMVKAIGTGTTVSKGDIITATLMNQLVTNANNM